jgi:hypothetical protein
VVEQWIKASEDLIRVEEGSPALWVLSKKGGLHCSLRRERVFATANIGMLRIWSQVNLLS